MKHTMNGFLIFSCALVLCACSATSFKGGEGTNGASSVGSGGGTGGDGGGGGGNSACTLTNATTVTTTLPSNVTAGQVAAICPAIGKDSECGTVIIITDSGESIYYTGQGPYDGSDDTSVGVLNLGSKPITYLQLASNLDIMGFDGDGIDTYLVLGTSSKVPGNSMDTTSYGGPSAYFTNIVSGNTQGTVNFITPVAPNGGSTFFSLENALSASAACLSTTAQ